MAGFFDGGGSFYPHRKGGRTYATMALGSTDPDSLLRCQALLGGKVYQVRRTDGRKPLAMLKCGKAEVVNAAMDLLYPLLSVRRRAQIDAVRAEVAANPPRQPARGWPKGKPRKPARV